MIYVKDIQDDPISLIWETGLREIGCIDILFPGQTEISFKAGDLIHASIGDPGSLQWIKNYTVWRVRGGERIEIIAFEFGQEWQAKAQIIYPGPRNSAIARLLAKKGERPGEIAVASGDKTYAQSESDIAFLYRLAGNMPVWRDNEGAVNVAYPPDVKVSQVIDYRPAAMVGKKYIAAGFTPDGSAFEVAVGEGIETRVAGVFYSPAEARDCLERLSAVDPKGRLICVGQAGLRAGCNVILPDGSKRRVTKCKHEVRHEAWTVTAYLN